MENINYIEIPSDEKIIAGNELIALFDSYAKNTNTGLFEDQSPKKRKNRAAFAYHESWEALMPVLKKIADTDNIYCSGVAEILRKNKFEILPAWSAAVKHIEFVNKKNNS